MFYLFNMIIFFVLYLVGNLACHAAESQTVVFATLYMLAVLIPFLAVGVRRLHDTNRSGWWLLIGFVPLIGSIVLIVFFVQDSQPGENQYGSNPKAVTK